MEIPYSLHPSELLRQCSAFGRSFLLNLDLRHPESRKRRALELERLGVQRPSDAHLLHEFAKTSETISVLDWPIVAEWNERWLQAKLLAEIHYRLESAFELERTSPSALLKVLIERIQEIQTFIQSRILPDDVSLIHLLWFRWQFAAVRDEARYLLQRLDRHLAENSARSSPSVE